MNKRLNDIAQVKSCAFVPVRARGDVIGVVFAAVRRPRLFDLDELVLMETLPPRRVSRSSERAPQTRSQTHSSGND